MEKDAFPFVVMVLLLLILVEVAAIAIKVAVPLSSQCAYLFHVLVVCGIQ
jgi:hypothetical protein